MILHGTHGHSANQADFHAAFIARVHELLQIGYSRLDAPSLRSADETAITGLLVNAIHGYLDDPMSPEWVISYSVYDDPPVNDGIRTGRRRNRVDIRLGASHARPRPVFEFEAKRLGARHPVRDYLGHDGLDCFLDGRYSRQHDSAGMLGYAQENDEPHWASEICRQVESRPTQFHLAEKPAMQPIHFTGGPKHVYISLHHRTSGLPDIRVYHTILRLFPKD